MATRDYNFVAGVETASLPSAATPSGDSDLVTKGYADARYASITTTIQGTGTYAVPQQIASSAALAFTGSAQDNIWFIKATASGGAIALGTSQQIAVPSRVGQILTIIGGSDTDTVQLATGNGLILIGGICILDKDRSITFRAINTTTWLEVGRS